MGGDVIIGGLSIYEVTPAWAAENIITKGELIFEVVFLHNPRGAEAAAVEVVLDVILFVHDFFEDFGERITTGIGTVLLLLSNRNGMRIDEMPHACITADEDKLLKSRTDAAGF